jgi:hypothetical protein
MLSAMRDQTLVLVSWRHDLPVYEATSIDDIPLDITAPFAETLMRSLEVAEIKHAFAAMTNVLLREIEK